MSARSSRRARRSASRSPTRATRRASGDLKLAKTILDAQTDKSQDEPHVLVRELRDQIDGGKKVSLLITTPAEGMAEAFYGLGELLTGEGGVSMGVLYLQMALYVVPDHAFALATLASAYESDASLRRRHRRLRPHSQRHRRCRRRSRSARPSTSTRSTRSMRPRPSLDKLAIENPKDIKPLDALGNIMRSRKRYAEAVDYYTRAIALLPNPAKRHWSLFYSRGTCYERLKNWPAAEADLQKALKLYPDQPLVLNYLGYSWVDQNRNLKQGMALIEKAVALKPDDGYIVDSLGWAHFKLGNYKDAVRFLERAVEIDAAGPGAQRPPRRCAVARRPRARGDASSGTRR